MDQMMPKGREHEAPDVLRQDIDIQAAESLHGVVAHLASASEEVSVGGGGRWQNWYVMGRGYTQQELACCCCRCCCCLHEPRSVYSDHMKGTCSHTTKSAHNFTGRISS